MGTKVLVDGLKFPDGIGKLNISYDFENKPRVHIEYDFTVKQVNNFKKIGGLVL